MRILVVQESDWLKRNPVQHHNILDRLSARGHKVVVVDYPIRWQDDNGSIVMARQVHKHCNKVVPEANVTVVRTATLRVPAVGKLSWLCSNAFEIGRLLRSFRPDVVVVLGLSNGLVAQRLAKIAGIPVVVHLLDALHTLAEPRAIRPVAAWVESRILRDADRVVVINKALGDYAVGMGAKPEVIRTIPTGIDTNRFGPSAIGDRLRAEHGIGDDETVMVFTGWLYTFSGLLEVGEAMADDTEGCVGLRLLVVGDGDLMPKLKRLRDERLGNRLILLGRQPAARMPELLAASDICLLPAQFNATMAHIVPAKLYEYMAAGKPVLASPLPGIQREFGSGSGILYVPNAHTLLQEAKRLASQLGQRVELGARARGTVEAMGSWDDVTAEFLDVLQDASSHKRLVSGEIGEAAV